MICRSCGAELEASARFCGVCGARVEAAPPQKAPPQQATVRASPPKKAPSPQASSGPASPASAAKTPHADPFIGQMLSDRFRIDQKLGEGGFGAVYRGTQTRTGRAVAIKLLHPEMTRDSNLVARFRREGEVLCQLRDAHTVTTYDFDRTAEGLLYIAMELLEGPTLHDVFRRESTLAWPRMIKILAEVSSALAEAHELGIIHRDLKPENIHLESRPGHAEFVKVLDFGIAKVMRGEDGSTASVQQLTATGQTLGTLEYMSPEQLMGRTLDGRSDIYAIGVLGYEMITGQLPFPNATGPAALISAQLKTNPDPPSKVRPSAGIPADVDALILRMLAKEPANRFASVQELKAACEALLGATASGQMPGLTPPGESPAMGRAPSGPPLSAAGSGVGPGSEPPPASSPAPVHGGGTASPGTKLWPWFLVAGLLAAAAVVSAVLLGT